MRVTNGNAQGQRIKFSTVVNSTDLPVFFARYLEICKMTMTALRPRDKRKKKKSKARKKRALPDVSAPRP
jgi:signal recognition particle subunit SRP14